MPATKEDFLLSKTKLSFVLATYAWKMRVKSGATKEPRRTPASVVVTTPLQLLRESKLKLVCCGDFESSVEGKHKVKNEKAVEKKN